jgi:predicted DNA-binding transcriptional regulator YafY
LGSRPLRVPRVAAQMAVPTPIPAVRTRAPGMITPTPGVPAQVPVTPSPRVPTRVRPSPVLESRDPRDLMGVIAQYGRARKLVQIEYRKQKGEQVVTRTCEPYSVRVKVTATGPKRYFYGFCLNHGSIHSYLIDRILEVKGTNRRFVPRWRVEF